jgi:hypothetical protein
MEERIYEVHHYGTSSMVLPLSLPVIEVQIIPLHHNVQHSQMMRSEVLMVVAM